MLKGNNYERWHYFCRTGPPGPARKCSSRPPSEGVDEHRRTVLEVLRDHPATAGELAALLPIARPGVSRHLRVLREAGLVDVDQQAQWRIKGKR